MREHNMYGREILCGNRHVYHLLCVYRIHPLKFTNTEQTYAGIHWLEPSTVFLLANGSKHAQWFHFIWKHFNDTPLCMWQIVYDSTSSARKQCTHTIPLPSHSFLKQFHSIIMSFCFALFWVSLLCLDKMFVCCSVCLRFQFRIQCTLRTSHRASMLTEKLRLSTHTEYFLCGIDQSEENDLKFSVIYVFELL